MRFSLANAVYARLVPGLKRWLKMFLGRDFCWFSDSEGLGVQGRGSRHNPIVCGLMDIKLWQIQDMGIREKAITEAI